MKLIDKLTLIMFASQLIGAMLMAFGNVFGAVLMLAPGPIGFIILWRARKDT